MSPLLQNMNNGESAPATMLKLDLSYKTTSARLLVQVREGDALVNWGPET